MNLDNNKKNSTAKMRLNHMQNTAQSLFGKEFKDLTNVQKIYMYKHVCELDDG